MDIKITLEEMENNSCDCDPRAFRPCDGDCGCEPEAPDYAVKLNGKNGYGVIQLVWCPETRQEMWQYLGFGMEFTGRYVEEVEDQIKKALENDQPLRNLLGFE